MMIQGRRERSLIKIYKDLMVTKRDLIDLRQSIDQTINSIKHSDQRLSEIQRYRRQSLRSEVNQHHGPRDKVQDNHALPRQTKMDNLARMRCDLCFRFFEDRLKLRQHKRQWHRICLLCSRRISESIQDHEQHSCPEVTFVCQFCSYQIKKKDLDAHTKVCGFRQCYKCKKDIYTRSYAFHMQQCGRLCNRNLIVPCKRIDRKMRPKVIPECLIIDEY